MKKNLTLLILLITLQSCIGAGQNSKIAEDEVAKTTITKTSRIKNLPPKSIIGESFPTLTGIDLQGNQRQLPQSFDGKLNLVIVAFKREQQVEVDSWIKTFAEISAKNPQINFYEVPLIYELSAPSRWWINNGMRQGVKSEAARSRTITVYTDRAKFFNITKMKAEKIYALLIDKSGKILWQSEGSSTPENTKSLQNFLKLYKK